MKAKLVRESFDYDSRNKETNFSDEDEAAFQEAKERAREISDDLGVVQHVEQRSNGDYIVSDWYDSDKTIISFENGRQL